MNLTLGPLAPLRHGDDISQYNKEVDSFDKSTHQQPKPVVEELGFNPKALPYKLVNNEQNEWVKVEEAPLEKKSSVNGSEKYYCIRPFDHLQLMDNGELLPCCPPWINHYSIGNINKQSYEEAWNGHLAQEFRRSILDGSFKYCNEKSCPHLYKKDGPLSKNARSKEVQNDILEGKTILDHGPQEVQFCYDKSCNLSCPSCRDEVIMVSKKDKHMYLNMQDKLQEHYLKDALQLLITGSGDAFGSPIFRAFLQTVQKEQAPKVESITLLTNGLLVKKYWHTLSLFAKEKINYINISIDASTEETYLFNRRGGSWSLLHENLKFVQQLEGVDLRTSMVVQDNNFREIKDFVIMSESYDAVHVQLQIIEPDFHYGKPDYINTWLKKAVHETSHKNHNALIKVLKDPFFDSYLG